MWWQKNIEQGNGELLELCCKEKPCVMQKDPDLLIAKIVLCVLLVRRL